MRKCLGQVEKIYDSAKKKENVTEGKNLPLNFQRSLNLPEMAMKKCHSKGLMKPPRDSLVYE
jgi:hypothetical protein